MKKKVEAEWTDRVKDGVKIRCWVSDEVSVEADMIKRNTLVEIAAYKKDDRFPFVTATGVNWKYAIPAKSKDLNLLENLEDV